MIDRLIYMLFHAETVFRLSQVIHAPRLDFFKSKNTRTFKIKTIEFDEREDIQDIIFLTEKFTGTKLFS